MDESLISWKQTSAIRLFLLLTVVTGASLDLRAQQRDRVITTKRSGVVENIRQPGGSLTFTNLNVVEVIGFSLGGVTITPGQVFQADDDWLTNLWVKVKNTSEKSISHLRMSFALPEAKFIQDGRNYSMGFALEYKAGARANNANAEMKVILPGDEVELVCLETGVALQQAIASRTRVTSITILQYGGDVTALFVDGSYWMGSNLRVGGGDK